MNLSSQTADKYAKEVGLSPKFLGLMNKQFDTPIQIILAIIKAESIRGSRFSMRYEKGYKYLSRPAYWASKFPWYEETEEELQRFSYGLMQIMLATARDEGFDGYPHALLDAELGVRWGCHHLSKLHQGYKNWPDAISAYNQGSPRRNFLTGKYKNQRYVDKVMRWVNIFEESV